MDIFIYGLPPQSTDLQLSHILSPHLLNFGFKVFDSHKVKSKGQGMLHVDDIDKGEAFLLAYKDRKDIRLHHKYWLSFKKNHVQDGGARLRDEKFREQRAPPAPVVPSLEQQFAALTIGPRNSKVFATCLLSCGAWDYRQSTPLFKSYYTENRLSYGKLLIGRASLVLLLFPTHDTSGEWSQRIDFAWNSIDTVVTSNGTHPSLIISCLYSPKMYRQNKASTFGSLGHGERKRQSTKTRIACLSDQHGEVAASCHVYQVGLTSQDALDMIRRQIRNGPEMPSTMSLRTRVINAPQPFGEELARLTKALSGGKYGSIPFLVKFQALKFALNGTLLPSTVSSLLPVISKLSSVGDPGISCAHALQRLYDEMPLRGPGINSEEFDPKHLEEKLRLWTSLPIEEGSVFKTVAKHAHLALVHHVRVTPTGLYLEGPEQEVSNRVLRRYPNKLEFFIRVTFSDEDGDRLAFQWNTSMEEIYDGIKAVLNDCISICGHKYTFLGSSSSSQKSHTAWFMAPFLDDKSHEHLDASQIIERLGDFSRFRSPAKCAARIGQAFTDTNGVVKVHAQAIIGIPDIERNNRNFSDGCGTISPALAAKVSLGFPRLFMKAKPIAFQIRFQGAKGMLSVDARLHGEVIGVRNSMKKFEAKDINDLEICGMADRALPLYLNRPLIKVLEDLGVPENGFLNMAQESINDLQQVVSSPINVATFLETERIGDASGLPSLIRRMDDINIDIANDRFLGSVVEMAAFVRLRDLKYKGRIPVKNGVKLMGIMDETGVLKEGEIYCCFLLANGQRQTITGYVVISRSPSNHPGDVQVVKAVLPPLDSQLSRLYNIVAFSQHGVRDLPSMLGGGDLDGDLYDVWWDPRLFPKYAIPPADYPRMPAIDIGRRVTTEDITLHFVDYMENDNVGMLSSMLLSLSDRLSTGTCDEKCIRIAELISTALDYPKTGIKANLRSAPIFDKSMKPDFLAPGPKVRIEQLDGSLSFERTVVDQNDPVINLDPEQRPTTYYKSNKVLGKLYRLIDEKGFHEGLKTQSQVTTLRQMHEVSEPMAQLWKYVQRAAIGVQYTQYLELARDIRQAYESNVNDMMHTYTLHASVPLHEIEVVSGCVLEATFKRRLKETLSDMRSRYSSDVQYTRTRIRTDENGKEDEALPRAMACFCVAVQAPGLRVGARLDGVLKSFLYVAAAVCLQELEIFHGGLLMRI